MKARRFSPLLAAWLAPLFALTLALTLAFAPCGSAAAGQALRFATWDDAETLAIQQKIVALFEARHPGVKVQLEAYGGGFATKLSAAFGARNPPDVMYMWNFPMYHSLLEPLDGFVARDRDIALDDMVAGLVNYATVRLPGKPVQLYGIPVGFTSQVIYYNKDMFDRAGLAYPAADWSWSDLRAMAVKLRNKDRKAYGYGIDVNPDPYDFQSYLWSAGGRMLAGDGKTVQGEFNGSASKAAFGMLVELLDQDLAAVLGVGDGKD
jgi:multiple sugar transport system substrate-binding protein